MRVELIDRLGTLAMRYNRASKLGKFRILEEVQEYGTADRELFVTMAAFYALLTVCES